MAESNASNLFPMSKVLSFACHIDGDVDKPLKTYRIEVVFKSHAEMLDCAAESVKRKVQQVYGRSNKLPDDRIVQVDSKGKFSQSLRDKMAVMSDDEKALALAEYKMAIAEMEKLMAEKAALSKDEPKTVSVKK